MLNYKDFIKEVKKKGVTHLYREVTLYQNDRQYNKVLYALKGTGRGLVGYYSPKSGGFVRNSSQWSASGRKFDKIKI